MIKDRIYDLDDVNSWAFSSEVNTFWLTFIFEKDILIL